MNSFQTIILGIFGFFIIAGLLAVAMTKSNKNADKVNLTMWGSESSVEVNNLIKNFYERNDKIGVVYREIDERELDQTIIEALAVGRGPDMVLLPAELLLRYRDKIRLIPYENYSARIFSDTFVQEGDLFLAPKGIYAFPFVLDPMVMYWNRDMFDEAGISAPPKYWDEFLTLAKNISEKDSTGNLSRSAVALGEYRNIVSAKEILSVLFLQSGNTIMGTDEKGAAKALLNQGGASAVLNFFLEFANPLKPIYSWNRSLPSSRNQFTSSRLAVYFGFGSEYKDLQKKNPNLNFDVALLPRPRNASLGITYGKLTGIAMLRGVRNPSVALQVLLTLTSPSASGFLHSQNDLPPVHRNLLRDKPSDTVGAILYDSASRARGFLDPNPAKSAGIFQTMIESVGSGKEETVRALSKANSELQSALR